MFLLEIIVGMLNNLQTSQDDSEQVQVIKIYLKSKGIYSIKIFYFLINGIKQYNIVSLVLFRNEIFQMELLRLLLRLQIWNIARI